MEQIFDFCIFRHFMAVFWRKFCRFFNFCSFFCDEKGHKMPKNTKIKNLFHAILDFMLKMIQTNFQVE